MFGSIFLGENARGEDRHSSHGEWFCSGLFRDQGRSHGGEVCP